MDGKHVLIRCPINSGSYYFNYKSTFSIVLLALVDADYKFLYVDVGCNGRVSDGGAFQNLPFGDALEHNKLNVPDSEEERLPYVVVTDDAFLIKTYHETLCAEKLDSRKKDIQLSFESSPSNS